MAFDRRSERNQATVKPLALIGPPTSRSRSEELAEGIRRSAVIGDVRAAGPSRLLPPSAFHSLHRAAVSS